LNAPESRVTTKELGNAASPKTCVIFAEPAGPTSYGWGWRAGAKQSKGFFRYFFDCVQDARKHGYAVELSDVAQSLKPPRAPDN
jgi:hypothetical protein